MKFVYELVILTKCTNYFVRDCLRMECENVCEISPLFDNIFGRFCLEWSQRPGACCAVLSPVFYVVYFTFLQKVAENIIILFILTH